VALVEACVSPLSYTPFPSLEFLWLTARIFNPLPVREIESTQRFVISYSASHSLHATAPMHTAIAQVLPARESAKGHAERSVEDGL